MKKIKKGNFIFYYTDYEKDNIEILFSCLQKEFYNQVKFWNFIPSRDIDVEIYPTQEKHFERIKPILKLMGHNDLLKKGIPDWATAEGGRFGIIMLSFQEWLDTQRKKYILYYTLKHELTHVFQDLILFDNEISYKKSLDIPHWLSEGLASYIPEMHKIKKKNIKHRFKNRKLLSFIELEKFWFNLEGDENLIYSEAKYIVVYLRYFYGINKVVSIFKQFTPKKKFDTLFISIIGKNISNFEKEVLNYLS